jgi:hypothetical protein
MNDFEIKVSEDQGWWKVYALGKTATGKTIKQALDAWTDELIDRAIHQFLNR